MKKAKEELRRIRFQGPEFSEWLALRDQVLRKPLGLDFSREDIAEEAEQVHLVCLREEKVVGGLILRKESDPGVAYHMRQVAVLPEFQGQGIGRRLVAFAENFVMAQGGGTIVLHAREPAVPFYEKLGYQTEGERFEEVGIPHWKMSKVLREFSP